MSLLKRMVLPLVFVAGISACVHPPATITTPAGQRAYTADQIVQRVNELQNAAISANSGNALDTNTTRIIVTFCVGADKTLAATPAGWQSTLLAAWTQAKKDIGQVTNPSIRAAISAVDVVIGSL